VDSQSRAARANTLPRLMLGYGAASLLHFAHNALFIAQYPNLPGWLSPAQVCAAWIGLTSVGLLGYGLRHCGFRFAGLAVVALYAVLGFDGLAHYRFAPFSAHTRMMNFTIWLEVAAAAALLVAVARQFAQLPQARRERC
jgi:hypothetical protein